MDRLTRLRLLALCGAAALGTPWLSGCATPPDGKPAAPAAQPVAAAPAPEPAAPPATPAAAAAPAADPAPASPAASQQAQRLALAAAEMLEGGNEDQALAEIQRALQADPQNRLAQSLLKQIQTDPQTLLGRESFSYRVEPGESLSRIAGRFLRDVHLFYALARYNDIKVPRQLQGGQTIRVPGKQPPAQQAVAPVAPPAPVAAPAAVAPPPLPPTVKPTAVEPSRATPAADVIATEYRRGLSLMAQQKPAEAVQAFDAVLERDPAHANAKLKRAQAVSQVSGLIRLLENNIRRLDGVLAQNPNNLAARAERDKAVADRERLLNVR
jgi:tetratricopeptide (TPR) repeat protein